MLNIAAFTFNYDQLEDRILLVGNLSNGQQRIDFWLTRKLVLRLLDAVQGLLEKTVTEIADAPVQQKMHMAQFHHEDAQQALQVQRESTQVMAESAVLLSRLDISHHEGQYKLLFFSGGDEPIAASVLSYQELHQIFHLLHRGAVGLDWGVAAELFQSSNQPQTLQ